MTDKCRRCGGSMVPSKALLNTWVAGVPDFPGSEDLTGQTMHHGGPGKLVDCLKCADCGWSLLPTPPSTEGGE